MCNEDKMNPDSLHKGFIKPWGNPWREIEFSDENGDAIYQGCVLLGKTADVLKEAERMAPKKQSMPLLFEDANIDIQAAGIKGAQFRWKNRTIPFVVNPDVPQPERITQAVAIWNAKTSIKFVPWNGQTDFVRVVRNQAGCRSAIGRQGGEQALLLADGCGLGNAIHELGHTIGFWHEQCRSDRDQFVEIVTDNISPTMLPQFAIILDSDNVTPYDFGSIMHYQTNSFGVTRTSITIRPRQPLPAGVIMGQRTGLSQGDIDGVEKLYAGIPLPVV